MASVEWTKIGLVQTPRPSLWWSQRYCILPTPVRHGDDLVRVYYGTTGADLVGRVTYVDLSTEEPGRVIAAPEHWVLDAGEWGTFDDCGVNPSCVIDWRGRRLLYYVGYQRTEKTPYLLFPGVAVAAGEQFVRLQRTPILDRTERELTVRTAPAILPDGDLLRMWYVAATAWRTLPGGKRVPEYAIFSAQSRDGISWTSRENPVLVPAGPTETGFGRPWVVREHEGFRMWYSIRQQVAANALGYVAIGTAYSPDGFEWQRQDSQAGISRGDTGWDAEMICYAATIKVGPRWWMLYNGNGNGAVGFGLAVRDA